jgi:acyl-CoA thioester hydrolase
MKPTETPAVALIDAEGARAWSWTRRVLPQHTDHAGVVWHGAYVAWLEEARVEALAAVGLAYSDLSARGLELPVVSLAIDYRQALLHGDQVEIRSWVEPRRGVKLPWRSLLLDGKGRVAAEARVELVLVAMGSAPDQRRLQRRMPEDLERAVAALAMGPVDGTDVLRS